MSPTIARFKSVRFVIHTHDHPPGHIHAVKDDCEAVVEIQTGRVLRVHGFSPRDLRQISSAVVEMQDLLQEKWDEIHEQTEKE